MIQAGRNRDAYGAPRIKNRSLASVRVAAGSAWRAHGYRYRDADGFWLRWIQEAFNIFKEAAQAVSQVFQCAALLVRHEFNLFSGLPITRLVMERGAAGIKNPLCENMGDVVQCLWILAGR